MLRENAVNIQGHDQESFATGGVSPLLPEGEYDVWADNDVYIKVDPTAAVAQGVTTSTGYPIFAGNVVPVNVHSKPCYIGAAGTGNVYYHRVK